jgi:predicted small secreted protein
MRKNVFILGITATVTIVATVNLYVAKTDSDSERRSLRLVNLPALTSETAVLKF